MSLLKLAKKNFFLNRRGEGGGPEVGYSKFGTILRKLSDEVFHTATCEGESCVKFISEHKSENRIHFGPTVQELRRFFASPPEPDFELSRENHSFLRQNANLDFSGPM